jgi:hypothetical protein
MVGTNHAMTWSVARDGPVSLDQPPLASPRSSTVTEAPLKEGIAVLDRVARIG